jgi:hypothetical protein
MPETRPYPLYELSEGEFERLCVDLLVAADSNLTLSAAGSPRWVDAVGFRRTLQGEHSVAVEVKHRTVFHPDGLRSFLERLSRENRKFDEYFFITSSPIPDGAQFVNLANVSNTLNAKVEVMGQRELVALLNAHPVVAAKYFKSARDRLRRRKIAGTLSGVAMATALGGLTGALIPYVQSKREPQSHLNEQVASVESSLARLNDVERSLEALKAELQQKSEESARVRREYEEAMKLQPVTAEQMAQVKKAVGSQSGMEIFRNYLFGFLLGVAGSVFATLITDWWKQRRALRRPYT